MSDLYENLKTEFQDSEYRYGYAESFLNTKLATQIKTLREQRGKTQAEVGALMGIKQPGYRRFEDINHSVWKTDALWNIARAHGVRLDISFKTFGSLLGDKQTFTKESLEVPEFKNDPVFGEPKEELNIFVEEPSGDVVSARTVAVGKLIETEFTRKGDGVPTIRRAADVGVGSRTGISATGGGDSQLEPLAQKKPALAAVVAEGGTASAAGCI